MTKKVLKYIIYIYLDILFILDRFMFIFILFTTEI